MMNSFFFFFFVTSQSARETKAAAHVLQTIWAYKDLRTTLNKAGWTKSHFKVPAAGSAHLLKLKSWFTCFKPLKTAMS